MPEPVCYRDRVSAPDDPSGPPRSPAAIALITGDAPLAAAEGDHATVLVLGPPALDGGAQSAALLRRALAHVDRPGARRPDAVIIVGPLTGRGSAAERMGLGALRRLGDRLVVVPGPADRGQLGETPRWLSELAGQTPYPRRVRLGGPWSLVVLDTLRLDDGRDAVGRKQLAELEALLGALPETARIVLVLAHRLDRRAADHPLEDASTLAELLAIHPVACVVHGQSDSLRRGRLGPIPTLAPPPLAGCRTTGIRALFQLDLPFDEQTPSVSPVHFAAPRGRSDLAEAFAARDAAAAWTSLAERIVEAEDTFAAVADAMQQQAVRFEGIAARDAELDGALLDLIRRAGEEPR